MPDLTPSTAVYETTKAQIKPGVLEKSSLTSGKMVIKCYPIEITTINGCFAWRYPTGYPIGYSVPTFKHMHTEWNGLPDIFGGDDDSDLLQLEETRLDFREYDSLYWEAQDGWNIRKSKTPV